MRIGVVCALLSAVCWTSVQGFYDHTDEVYDLTQANFQKLVLDSHFVWIVEFYAPWCGHCQSLAPEFKKASNALKGIVRLGAVNADEHKQLGGQYGVKGFPTIKIFGSNKKSPSDYNGARSAEGFVSEGLSAARVMANDRLGGKKSGGSSGGGGGSGGNEVVELTDNNFESTVLSSDDIWLVEFYAPWCGHCKSLAPHWKSAASELRGKAKLGAIDATVHKVLASRYGIQGFPTIKYFPAGKKDSSGENYDGGRTSDDIVRWVMDRWTVNLPPPDVYQLTSQEVLDTCAEKQICFISFLPHILDSMAAGRNDYLDMLKSFAEKYKQRSFGWVWLEGGSNPDFEQALEVGGFGYPAMVGYNSRRNIYIVLRASFSESGLNEFLGDIVRQKGRTQSIKGDGLPAIEEVELWDGKDGELPVEDDYDLDDFDMDDEPGKDEL
ncbi:protein disulfide-isomerase A6 homolog [Halichondria panicea]|uniref:protein disulfide-isomerase A6 homolog n=1 Tax=Halichondria panicea TaxID=6063 RepID=UPI00312B5A86